MQLGKSRVAYTSEPHTWQESVVMLPQQQGPHLATYYGLPDNHLDRESAHVADNNHGDYSVLHLACATGNVGYFKLLLEKSKVVNGEVCGCHGDDGGDDDDDKKGAGALLTPLCCAASCGNAQVMQLLIDCGADVNRASGPSQRTPLHLAATNDGNADCLQVLLKSGACHDTVDIKGQTPLHMAAYATSPELIAILLRSGADPNVVDHSERTPLHATASAAAAATNNKNIKKVSECVRLLLEDGRVDINAQDIYGYTALHLSAMSENTKCVSLLLRHGSDVTLKTADGITALSMLARKLPDVMKYLEEKLDSGVTLHDFDLVDANCEIKFDFSVLIPTGIKRSFSSRKKLRKNNKDKSRVGSSSTSHQQQKRERKRKETELLTCLVSTGNKKLLEHPLTEAFLLLKWRRVRKFFLASLLFQMALVALFTIFVVEVYLIRCPYKRHQDDQDAGSSSPLQESHQISKRDAYPNPRSFPGGGARDDDGRFSWFRVVVPPKRKDGMQQRGYPPPPPQFSPPTQGHAFPPPQIPPPLGVPSHAFAVRTTPRATPTFHYSFENANDSDSKFRRIGHSGPELSTTDLPSDEEALVTESSSGSTESSNLEVAADEYPEEEQVEQPSRKRISNPTKENEAPPKEDSDDNLLAQQCSLNWPLHVIWLLLVLFITLMSLQELFQLIHSPARYVVSSENWTQWLLISSVMITAWRGGSSSDSSGDSSVFQLDYWQYPAAASGILIAWGLILFQVGRFPSLGLYVEMLSKVAANFGLFILAYACLLIAFALSFCVLFPEHPPFSSVPLSILKVFTMMVGEVDYEDLFYSEERSHDPILFPITAHLLFGAFVLIMTIVLMNLLVGLAVSDIQGLQKGARLDRLCRQTALIARFESFIFSRKLETVLPASLIQFIQQNSLLSSENRVNSSSSSSHNHLSIYFRPNNPSDRSLPKDIKLAALRLLTTTTFREIKKSTHFTNLKADNSCPQAGKKVKRSLTSASQWKHGHGHDGQWSRINSNDSTASYSTNSADERYHFSGDKKIEKTKCTTDENATEKRLRFLEAKLETIDKNIEQILNVVTRQTLNSSMDHHINCVQEDVVTKNETV